MGKIIAVNAGSTSIKMAIFDDFAIQDGQTTPLAEYRWEKDVKKATIKFGAHKYVHEDVPFEKHSDAFRDGINCFREAKCFTNVKEIASVVNRAVNGGELLQSPAPIEITANVQKEFEKNLSLAPNHNPPALEVSKVAQKLFQDAKHYYMFDTGWHSTMPMKNQMYALPKECFEIGIKAFGAHGIVYMDNSMRAAEMLDIPMDEVNLILLHLGGGCSANAVKNGKSIDTTMGYTPIDGLMMATRCGHLDPGVLPKLVKRYGGVEKVMEVLTKKSGFYGLTGEADMRNVKKKAEKGDKMAIIAIDRFVNEVRKTVGAYLAELDYNVDAIVCSGGIAENDTEILRKIFSGFEGIGIPLDDDPKKVSDEEYSYIPVLILPANEELAMAKAIMEIK